MKRILFLLVIFIGSLGFANVRRITIYGNFGLVRATKVVHNGYGKLTIKMENKVESVFLVCRQSDYKYYPDINKNNTFIYSKLPAYGEFDLKTVPENIRAQLVRID